MVFLRNVLATLVGLFVFFGILLAIIFVFFAAAAASGNDTPKIEDASILYLDLSGVVVEQTVEDPFQELLSDGPRQLALLDILESIEKAKNDDRIRGMYIEAKFLIASMADMEEIRAAVADFKSSDKFIYAYGTYLSESDYYIASLADEIFINPSGGMEFNGLSINITFLTGLMEKLDIEPVVFRVGEFKSAVEPFMRKDMSKESRLQYSELLKSVYDHYLKNVSEARDIGIEKLENISDSMLATSPEEALEYRLITGVKYEDEVKSLMREKLKLEEDDKLHFVSVANYAKVVRADRKSSKNRIAVIVAEGNIVNSGTDGVVGGEDYAKLIKKARENDRVKAIVLRINSPGGDAVASDLMWREVERTKGVKPIIASFSGVAASGGYYMAMACDTIVAQPTTITGSIGIFALLYNFQGFLNNKLGITNDQVKTGDYSDFITVNRALTPYEKSVIQSRIETFYDRFITKVADGRSMEKEAIRAIAGGRVWSGLQAEQNGLVDILDDYRSTLALAADMANVKDDYSISMYPKPKSFVEQFFSKLEDSGTSILMKDPILATYQKNMNTLRQSKGIQAKLPGDPEIR